MIYSPNHVQVGDNCESIMDENYFERADKCKYGGIEGAQSGSISDEISDETADCKSNQEDKILFKSIDEIIADLKDQNENENGQGCTVQGIVQPSRSNKKNRKKSNKARRARRYSNRRKCRKTK